MTGFLGELVTEILGEIAGIFTASKLGFFGKIAGKAVANEKVQAYVSKKAGEFFGQIVEPEKTLEEELLTVDLVNFLEQAGPTVDAFIAELRQQNRGEEKVTAFRVFLASGIKKGSRQRKDFIPNPADKTGKGKPSEETYTLLDVKWGESFIKRMLAKATFDEKVKFLEDQGVFSTMKKKTEPHPIVEKTKKVEKANRENFNQTMTDWRMRAKAWRTSR